MCHLKNETKTVLLPDVKSKAVAGHNDTVRKVFWRYSQAPFLSLAVFCPFDQSFAILVMCLTLQVILNYIILKCVNISLEKHIAVLGDGSLQTVLPTEACKLTPASA